MAKISGWKKIDEGIYINDKEYPLKKGIYLGGNNKIIICDGFDKYNLPIGWRNTIYQGKTQKDAIRFMIDYMKNNND